MLPLNFIYFLNVVPCYWQMNLIILSSTKQWTALKGKYEVFLNVPGIHIKVFHPHLGKLNTAHEKHKKKTKQSTKWPLVATKKNPKRNKTAVWWCWLSRRHNQMSEELQPHYIDPNWLRPGWISAGAPTAPDELWPRLRGDVRGITVSMFLK